MYLLLETTITKSYKLNTAIIYRKLTNNDDIKRDTKSLKRFLDDDTKNVLKGALIKILKKFDNNCIKTV